MTPSGKAGPALAGTVTTVVIGAGHAGLAMSHCLGELGIDHVVLERGEVANSWRQERWDSLRLLTPNWLSRLPGWTYAGDSPDGFMDMAEVVGFIDGYARFAGAPVHTGTTVTAVEPAPEGYRVVTDRGVWRCRTLVLASGACNRASLPSAADAVPAGIVSCSPLSYRNPEQLPDGGVLVVGASASGVQLADEIHGSGRPVVLSVGEHVRLPRVYGGRDIQWWMDRTGLLDERHDAVDDLVRVRRLPSPQLVGTPQRLDLDLNALTARGVALVGRFAGIQGRRAQFSGSLRNTCALADLKMSRLLNAIDDWNDRCGETATRGAERPAPTRVPDRPPLSLDLRSGTIRSIVWATGFRPDYRWLGLPVIDAKGRLRHEGGVVDAPGVYALGLPFMRRRKSSFIHGAEDDARELAAHLHGYLAGVGDVAGDRIRATG